MGVRKGAHTEVVAGGGGGGAYFRFIGCMEEGATYLPMTPTLRTFGETAQSEVLLSQRYGNRPFVFTTVSRDRPFSPPLFNSGAMPSMLLCPIKMNTCTLPVFGAGGEPGVLGVADTVEEPSSAVRMRMRSMV